MNDAQSQCGVTFSRNCPYVDAMIQLSNRLAMAERAILELQDKMTSAEATITTG